MAWIILLLLTLICLFVNATINQAGPWRYTESGCVPPEAAVTARFEDGKFVKLTDRDLVLDVAHWKMKEGQPVNWVGGTSAKEKTKLDGGGRDWTINEDGTISAKHHPHLVLGVEMEVVELETDLAEYGRNKFVGGAFSPIDGK